MATRLLRLPAVCELTGLGRSRVYKLIQEKSFPAPVQLGVRSVAWPESEIMDWIEARLKGPRKLDRTLADTAVVA
jgi:prophage regulatory protein